MNELVVDVVGRQRVPACVIGVELGEVASERREVREVDRGHAVVGRRARDRKARQPIAARSSAHDVLRVGVSHDLQFRHVRQFQSAAGISADEEAYVGGNRDVRRRGVSDGQSRPGHDALARVLSRGEDQVVDQGSDGC